MAEDSDIRCPECGGPKLERYGWTKAGKRKFRCLNPGRAPGDTRPGPCRRQFVWPQDREISPETKEKIKKLLDAGTSPSVIQEAFHGEVSLRWIFKFRKEIGSGRRRR